MERSLFHERNLPGTAESGSPAAQQAVLCVTGDLLMHQPILDSCLQKDGTYDFHPVFSHIHPYLESADCSVANLETTLCGPGRSYSGYPRFNSPDSLVDALRDAGLDLLLTANNHSFDTEADGFFHTIRVIREAGLDNLGTRLRADEPEFRVVNIHGIRIGMACFTYETETLGLDGPELNCIPVPPEFRPLISSFRMSRPELLYAGVSSACEKMRAEGADVTVLFLHWGTEYERRPSEEQRAMAQQLCELGVDVIIGGHSHVLQPAEWLQSADHPGRRTLCLYSTGNELSNQRFRKRRPLSTPFREDGILFFLRFVRRPDGAVSLDAVRAVPTWVRLRKEPKMEFRILPLDRTSGHWASRYPLRPKEWACAWLSWLRTAALFRRIL